MSVQYHYSRGGQSYGPVSVEQLRQLAATGQLSATDLVWRDGLAEWVPAGRLKGLFGPAAGPAAPASPAAHAAPHPAIPSPAASAGHAPAAPAAGSAAPPAFPPTESSPEFRVGDAAVRPVPQATESSPEFRLADLGPTVHSPYVIPPPDSQKPEPTRDTTQVEVFAQQAKVAAMAAGSDALKAFKVMAKNPVGGLRTAYENLGDNRSMAVGIFFAVLYALVFVFAGRAMVAVLSDIISGTRGYGGAVDPHSIGHLTIGVLFKLILLGALPFGVAVGGFAAVRAMFKGGGTIFSDMFVAGASLVPPAIFLLAAWILGALNVEIILAIGLFAMTTSVLILYSGFNTLQRVPESAATIAIPLMFLADFYISTVVLRL